MQEIAGKLAERGANYAKGAANNAPYNIISFIINSHGRN